MCWVTTDFASPELLLNRSDNQERKIRVRQKQKACKCMDLYQMVLSLNMQTEDQPMYAHTLAHRGVKSQVEGLHPH